MSDLLEPVRAGGLLRADRAVIVMYSGGPDSTCLLDLAVRIAGPERVTALHLNYGLRDTADRDERHCADTCRGRAVRLERRRPDRAANGNVQAWARDVRYTAARELAAEAGADIAAGHTATDQVETILYRLASSPSRRALLGMRDREGATIRPLLRFTRAQVRVHCEVRGLTWVQDPTNDSRSYARGRVRHELMPALARVHPGAEANVLALAARLADEAAVLDELVDAVIAGEPGVELPALRELAPALRRLVVQRLADAALGRPAAGVARRAEEVCALPEHGTHHLDLPAGIRATACRGTVTFAVRGPDQLRRI